MLRTIPVSSWLSKSEVKDNQFEWSLLSSLSNQPAAHGSKGLSGEANDRAIVVSAANICVEKYVKYRDSESGEAGLGVSSAYYSV
jgi:hypothetical protein